ncbi:ATP-binding protein [Actinophytocola sp.]|uniref:AAA family ATPase n=1 Tax=Actinophytocola sp. TaxID=1872138 RepID=UPI002ED43DA0
MSDKSSALRDVSGARRLTRRTVPGLTLDELESCRAAVERTLRRGVAGQSARATRVLRSCARVRDLIDREAERRLHAVAWSTLPAAVLVICGASATGKTRRAEKIALTSGRPRLSTDRVRKQLAGVGPLDPAPCSAYTEAASLHTYAELGRRAVAAGTAVVDGTFRRRTHRDAFRAACGGLVRPLFVECVAPAATIAERARGRAMKPGTESDATPEVALTTLAEFEPLDDVPPADRLVLSTDRPPTFAALGLVGLLASTGSDDQA